MIDVCVGMFSAQQHGLLCEVDYTEDGAMDEVCDPFFAHCKVHADKDLTKRKVMFLWMGGEVWEVWTALAVVITCCIHSYYIHTLYVYYIHVLT